MPGTPYCGPGSLVEVPILAEVVFTRVLSTVNPLVGSWYGVGVGDEGATVVVIFLEDGTFMPVSLASVLGVEFGNWTWNPENGALYTTRITATTGEFGFGHDNTETVFVEGGALVFPLEGEILWRLDGGAQ